MKGKRDGERKKFFFHIFIAWRSKLEIFSIQISCIENDDNFQHNTAMVVCICLYVVDYLMLFQCITINFFIFPFVTAHGARIYLIVKTNFIVLKFSSKSLVTTLGMCWLSSSVLFSQLFDFHIWIFFKSTQEKSLMCLTFFSLSSSRIRTRFFMKKFHRYAFTAERHQLRLRLSVGWNFA